MSLYLIPKLLIKSYDNHGSLSSLREIPVCFPLFWRVLFQQLRNRFPVNAVLHCIPVFVLIFVSFL